MANPFDELLRGLPPSDMGGQVSLPQGTAPAKRGKGEIILGIIADGLAGLAGRQGGMAQQWGREDADARQQQQEQAQWGLRRQADLEDYGRKLEMQNDPRYAKPDVAPMMRDAMAWQSMTDEQRQAYGQMKSMGAADPDVFTTLPNGQFYAGPRSGLATALGGGQQTQRPVGRLTPINGGPAPQAPGGFPY